MEVTKCEKVNQLMLKRQDMIGIHDRPLRFLNYCSFHCKEDLSTKTVEIWTHKDTSFYLLTF